MNDRSRRLPSALAVLCCIVPSLLSLVASAQSPVELPAIRSSAAKSAGVQEDPEALRKLIIKIVENSGETKYTFTSESSEGSKSSQFVDSSPSAALDLKKCTFMRTSMASENDKPYTLRTWIRLGEVKRVETGDANEIQRRFEASWRARHPGQNLNHVSFSPSIPAVKIFIDEDNTRQFPVATAEDGEHLAKSLQRIVALCGGAGASRAAAEREEEVRKDLETTRRFIVDTLSNEGKISYSTSIQNTNDKSSWTALWTYQLSDPSVDFTNCGFSWKQVRNQGTQDNKPQNMGVWLTEVQDVMVAGIDDAQKEVDANAGHPEFSELSTPPVSALIIRMPKGAFNFLLFHSDAVAGRVRKAVKHAAELCGGMGGDSPF
jgi:hypothetical protein